MMHIAWILTVAALAAFAELAAGRFGLLMPFFLAAAFYLIVTYPAWRVVLPLGIMALVLDLSFARGGFVTLVLVLAILYGAGVWIRHGDCRPLTAQVIPGVCLGIMWGGGLVITEKILQQSLSWRMAGMSLSCLLETTLMGGLALPVTVAFLDILADRLGLPEYRTVRKKHRI